MSRAIVPVATYRLQLTPEFGFAAARRALAGIAGLGVSHVYLSPILEARRGSTHGYDGTDPRAIRGELGGRRGFGAFVREARKLGLRLLLDIVPNHLATSPQGAPFRDLLLRGPRSRFARWFDVDWDRLAPDGARAIVLPRLERSFEEALERGELRIHEGAGVLEHGDERFPWRPPAHFRLVPWREGMGALNYSRYLDIADLIRVRVEDERVFEETHGLVRELIEREAIDGLRIDHLDGLLEPERYLDRLHRLVPRARRGSFWIVSEATASEVPNRATTGYDFLSAATRALLDVGEVRAFDRAARWPEGPRDARRACLARARELLAPDLASRKFPERTARYVRSKAIEDTLLFRDARTLALNELGHDPHAARKALGKGALSDLLESQRSAISLNATSTHDTKRSEDVRTRLIALTARSREFAALIAAIEDAGDWPRSLGRAELWYSVQTLLAAWPVERELLPAFENRIAQHLEKAAREAKWRSSWIAPDRAYEAGWSDSTLRLLRADLAPWRTAFDSLRREIAGEGDRLSLTLLAWKCFLPGVPDFYQGAEGKLLRLTDPDNRDAVDFARLRADDSAKARATRIWLALRARRISGHVDAPVRFLSAHGRDAQRVIAFTRGKNLWVITHGVGERKGRPRLDLPRGRYRDEFHGHIHDGGEHDVLDLCGRFGVAVLERS